MVLIQIQLNDEQDQIITILKGKWRLNNKNLVIQKLIEQKKKVLQ